MERKLLAKILPGLISIVIVLIIFVGFIGILFPLIISSAIEHIKITSIIYSLIGVLIIIFSKYWPILRFRSFVRKTGNKKNTYYDSIGSIIIGLSFVVGGILYAYLENHNAMMISFLVGIVLYRLVIFYLNFKK